MAGGRSSRTKGVGGERELVTTLRAHGLEARRVPLSGAAEGFKGDVQVRAFNRDLTGEVKRRRAGFRTLQKWLGNHDFLALRDDYGEWLMVVPLDKMLAMMGLSEEVANVPVE